MKAAGFLVAGILAAIAQVTVAPLFPLSGAVPDVVLLTLVTIAVFSSPRPVMYATPVAAIALGFLTDRGAGLMLLAYLPLLPLGYVIQESRVPVNHFARTVAMTAATGLWARTLLAAATMVDGAEPAVGDLLAMVLLPGLFLDFALLMVAYIPSRLIGWTGEGMALRRSGYYTGL